MTEDRNFVIEDVRDLDAVWSELIVLYLESEDYSRAFRSRALSDGWEEGWREQMAPSDGRLVLLARTDGDAVGYLVVEVVRDFPLFPQPFGYLRDAFVRADMRRRGIGQAMLAQAENWCLERGALDLRLDVWANNSIGRRFWERVGFEVQSVTMKKSLR
jgi:GNAT superfamily N-acetyltransferase